MPDDVKARAEAQFKKGERASDAKNAAFEYQTDARKLRTKTERLRVLRLEKEAADLKGKIAKKKPVRKKGASRGR